MPFIELNPFHAGDSDSILISSTFFAILALFSAFTVKLKDPSLAGVPDITPSSERVRPGGKLPSSRLHIMGVSPVASSDWL